MSTKAVDLDLLNTYHPKKYFNYSALGQAFKFLVLAGVWISIILGASIGGAVTFAWLLPWLANAFLPALGLSAELVKNSAEVLGYLAPIVTVATIIPVNALFMVLCERKFLSLLTMRMGPTEVGPNGFLQTLADALKLLFKEDICPEGSDKLLFTLAPALFFAPAMVVFLPLMSVAANNIGVFAHTDIDVGLIFILAISSLGTMSIVMGGWASNNKYSLMGGMRSAAQAVSYEIPMVLSMIAIILMTGSVNLVAVSESQKGGLLNWNVFGQGALTKIGNIFAGYGGNFLDGLVTLAFVALCVGLFVVFVISAIAEVNRIPFDLPEAESELVSGFNTEYTGMKFALFFLAEYTNLFVVSAVAVVLFLGGSHLPVSSAAENAILASISDVSIQLPVLGTLSGLLANLNLVWVLTSAVFITKIYLMFLLAIWVRATLPRLRQDQLMEFCWKYLIPIALLGIFLMAIIMEYLG